MLVPLTLGVLCLVGTATDLTTRLMFVRCGVVVVMASLLAATLLQSCPRHAGQPFQWLRSTGYTCWILQVPDRQDRCCTVHDSTGMHITVRTVMV
jgi:hypothetical protein